MLTDLQTLVTSSTGLVGTIPTEVGQLTNLKEWGKWLILGRILFGHTEDSNIEPPHSILLFRKLSFPENSLNRNDSNRNWLFEQPAGGKLKTSELRSLWGA